MAGITAGCKLLNVCIAAVPGICAKKTSHKCEKPLG